jgi:hypothetical protein
MQEAEELLVSEGGKENNKKTKLCPHCGLEL